MQHFLQIPDFRAMYSANRILEIPIGQTVTLTSGDWDLIWVEGTLVIPRNSNLSLTVREIVITPTGFFDGGTATDPVLGNVEIIWADGPLDTSDPSQWGKGLLVFGKINLHGKVKTPYVELIASPVVNDTDLAIQPPINWQVGDMVAIPATAPSSTNMYELRLITSIGVDHISIDTPLTQNYPPVIAPDGSVFHLGYVANMTRNICFKSANPTGVKGHSLCADRAEVDMRYVCFEDMGRTIGSMTLPDGTVVTVPTDSTTFNPDGTVLHYGTNQIGRYAVHMHHLWGPTTAPMTDSVDWPGHDSPQFRLVGLAMLVGAKWGMSIHASHFGLIRSCVTIGFDGAGIISEDGSETSNVFAENLSCVLLGDHHPDRYDHEGTSGACYWQRNNHNYYFNNIAAGGTEGLGFYIANSSDNNASANMPVPIPNFPGADMDDPAQFTMVPINQLPLLGWSGNLIYAAKKFGLGLWSLQNLDIAPVFGETKILNTEHTPLYLDYSSATFEDMTIIGGLFGIRSHNPNHARSINNVPIYPLRFIRYDIRGCGQAWIDDDRPGQNSFFEDGYCQCVKGFIIDSNQQGYSDRNYTFINPDFSNVPGQPLHCIEAFLNPIWEGGDWSFSGIWHKVNIKVFGYLGQIGNDFRVWYNEQSSDYIVPVSISNALIPNQTPPPDFIYITFPPEPNKTNQYIWDTYGVAPLLEIAPTNVTTISGINGLIESMNNNFPTVSLTASPQSINLGESSTLTWTTTNATSVMLNGNSVALNGSMSVSPTSDTTYTLVASKGSNTAQSQVTVAVVQPVPTVSFSANPTTINAGESSTLTWATSNSNSVTLDGVSVALNSSQVVSPSVTQTYTLVVSGNGGTVTNTVTITVNSTNPCAQCEQDLAAALAKIADYEQRFLLIKNQIPSNI